MCSFLQDILFEKIQDGAYEFPDREWANISAHARDLIKNMLVRDPRGRYTADDILDHPWISEPVAATFLATPGVLSRNSSTQLLDTWAEKAMACNRRMMPQLPLSESRASISSADSQLSNPFFSPLLSNENQGFYIGHFSDDDDDDGDDESDNEEREIKMKTESLYNPLKLCLPSSKLAQRRLSQRRV